MRSWTGRFTLWTKAQISSFLSTSTCSLLMGSTILRTVLRLLICSGSLVKWKVPGTGRKFTIRSCCGTEADWPTLWESWARGWESLLHKPQSPGTCSARVSTLLTWAQNLPITALLQETTTLESCFCAKWLWVTRIQNSTQTTTQPIYPTVSIQQRARVRSSRTLRTRQIWISTRMWWFQWGQRWSPMIRSITWGTMSSSCMTLRKSRSGTCWDWSLTTTIIMGCFGDWKEGR